MIIRKIKSQNRLRAAQLFLAGSMLVFSISAILERLVTSLNLPPWLNVTITILQGLGAGLVIPSAMLFLYMRRQYEHKE